MGEPANHVASIRPLVVTVTRLIDARVAGEDIVRSSTYQESQHVCGFDEFRIVDKSIVLAANRGPPVALVGNQDKKDSRIPVAQLLKLDESH